MIAFRVWTAFDALMFGVAGLPWKRQHEITTARQPSRIRATHHRSVLRSNCGVLSMQPVGGINQSVTAFSAFACGTVLCTLNLRS
ncbi:hypothetical protein F5148DRAFT_1217214 [Russula earlei]|uniref:Uncharacterized protein n=1 Tax=Russula earlei TaxID=71964 RepID=A0ACC0U2Z3_9AGAM|nr:hypothetical protein F5148DRAFT_1217214 [Russula earlei]